MLIDFKKIIYEFSDESFIKLKEYLKPYIYNYFLENESIDRNTELEKIGEFLKCYEEKAKIKDNALAYTYSSKLVSYVNNRVYISAKEENKNKAEQFLQRAKETSKKTQICADGEELLTLLEDVTKAFLSIYPKVIEEPEAYIKDTIGSLYEIDIVKVIEFFRKDTPAISSIEKNAPTVMKKIVGKQILKGVDDMRKGIVDFQKQSQDTLKDIGDEVKQLIKQDPSDDDPIYSWINRSNENDVYSEKSFISILLIMLYLRISDYELEF